MGTIVKVVMFILPIGGSQMWRPPELGKGPLASQTWETKPMRGGARTFGQTQPTVQAPPWRITEDRGPGATFVGVLLRGAPLLMSPPVFSGQLLHLQTPCLSRHSRRGFTGIGMDSVSETGGQLQGL